MPAPARAAPLHGRHRDVAGTRLQIDRHGRRTGRAAHEDDGIRSWRLHVVREHERRDAGSDLGRPERREMRRQRMKSVGHEDGAPTRRAFKRHADLRRLADARREPHIRRDALVLHDHVAVRAAHRAVEIEVGVSDRVAAPRIDGEERELVAAHREREVPSPLSVTTGVPCRFGERHEPVACEVLVGGARPRRRRWQRRE